MWKRGKFFAIVGTLQVAFVILFAVLGDYDEQGDAVKSSHRREHGEHEEYELPKLYPMFADVHVMIFVGFGFLMTFLRRYGYSSIGLNLLVAAFTCQWHTIVFGMISSKTFGYFTVGIESLLTADFACAAVLISMGAVLGKTSPLQLIVMILFEIVIFVANEYVTVTLLQIADIGGSVVVHSFGAYFGLAVARMIFKKDVLKSSKEGSVYHSDLFSMIGTIFLWIFWPSFNSALAEEDGQSRAVINTYYAIAASTVAVFAVSSLLNKKSSFDMVAVQNATLAGGVAVGTTANMVIYPYGAVIIGIVAGSLSTVGYQFLTPFLNEKAGFHDTCGVNNLHGMPGLLAGIAGAVVAALATPEKYGDSLYKLYPAMASSNSTLGNTSEVNIEVGRTPIEQGGYQMAAVCVTLAFAIVGGCVTGLILRLPIWDEPKGGELFDDEPNWSVSEETNALIDANDQNEAVLTIDYKKKEITNAV
ncbi:unnamed protein product [Owenia fusiformis]|uniref:Uncharacterized protein n=1 Tax=Owenia fusiformis TaxID=6347 RepID=A0A8J1XH65_OWEFU|nr:unnamed protein product [Owenia fusiformis]